MESGAGIDPRSRRALVVALLAAAAATAAPARAASVRDRWFTAGDGARLHYLEAGPAGAPTIVFVPGWTMPAWIWERQVQAFAGRYHVVAFDPRGQGESEITGGGYVPDRRGRDIGELIEGLGPRPVLLVAWSLGVLDALAYVAASGDARLAGLVLVDNSIGEDPPPPTLPRRAGPRPPREAAMREFVHGMFRTPQDPAWLDRLVRTCLRTPEPAARALLAYPLPRSYWRDAVHGASRPLLYVIRPRWSAQAEALVRARPAAETALFEDAGHALFIDRADRFNAVLGGFIDRRVWVHAP